MGLDLFGSQLGKGHNREEIPFFSKMGRSAIENDRALTCRGGDQVGFKSGSRVNHSHKYLFPHM